jgi:hypothetical protein
MMDFWSTYKPIIMAIVFACAVTGLLVWNDPTLLHACR